MDVFKRGEPIRGFQGGMFPNIRVPVTGMALDGCSMRLVVEPRYTPGEAVLVKACTHFTAGQEEGYYVKLTSADTDDLLGVYNAYFVLTDGDGEEYRNLWFPLEVLASPEEAVS